jgi:hypothetical protein
MVITEPNLTVENILNKTDQYIIFKTYCPPFEEVGKAFHSELRKDPKPSAFITYYNDRLWYKDFGAPHSAVDCFGYVMLKYNLTFRQALNIINSDLRLGLNSDVIDIKPGPELLGFFEDIPKYKITEKLDTLINPIYRNWNLLDKKYWYDTYGIDKKILTLFDVRPITGVYLTTLYRSNTKRVFINKNDLSYSYLIDKEVGIERFKIYSPYGDRENKWLSNCKSNHYQGFNQLPLIGNTLVITKSLKDVMVLYVHGVHAIAPQSESQNIDKEFYDKLCRRFDKIVIFYDNDEPGINGASKLISKFNLYSVVINSDSDNSIKDISDYREYYGYQKTKELLMEFKLI